VDGLQLRVVPDVPFLSIAAAAAAVLFAAVLFAAVRLRRSRRGGGPMVLQPQALPEMKGSYDAARGRAVNVALGRELLPLLERGRTEEAVALVRARTGWGEAEARASVERLTGLMKRLGME
jgi:hypothetical protein